MLPYKHKDEHETHDSDYDSQSYSDCLHRSDSAVFRSFSSMRSVPSLTSQSHQQPHGISSTHHHCLTTLTGHTSYISSVSLAGKYLYTGSSDKEIRFWRRNQLETEDEEYEDITNSDNDNNNMIIAGKGAVKSLVVLANRLFSAHQDHKIRIWKINYKQEHGDHDDDHHHHQKYTHIATLPTLGDRVSKLLIPKNHVQIIRHKKLTWVHHVDTVSALALSSDETLLYSVSWDRTLKIWRTTDFKCLESVANAHEDAINAIAISENGYVYTGSADKKIKVWRKNIGDKKHSLVTTLEKHKSGINALALSGDGSILYSGACDRSIVVWEKDDSGKMLVAGALRGHTKSILCLAVVSDLVCSGSADTTIRIWKGEGQHYSCLALLEGHKGPVKCLTGAADGSSSNDASYLLYSGSLDCDIKVWKIRVPIF